MENLTMQNLLGAILGVNLVVWAIVIHLYFIQS
jgi:hypothetical protein